MELETRKIQKKEKKRRSRSVSSNRKNSIEDWYILPEVWQAKEIIYDAHVKYGSHLKVKPTYNEILRAGYRWDNMLIDIRDFYFKWQVWEIRTSKPRKNIIVKHIESYKPKERYQADTVLLSNYIWDGFKYIFTMVDHFTKYGWIIPLNNKKAVTILRAFKKWVTTNNILDWLQTDNGREFKNDILEKFCESKGIDRIYGVPYNPQHQGAVEAFNNTVQNFLTPTKDHQKDRYNLEESINDFLIYYNDREHSTTKVAPFRAMMNIENKDLIHKIRENTKKRRQKVKMVTETFLKNSIVRVSNFIRFIDEKHIRFNPPRGYKNL